MAKYDIEKHFEEVIDYIEKNFNSKLMVVNSEKVDSGFSAPSLDADGVVVGRDNMNVLPSAAYVYLDDPVVEDIEPEGGMASKFAMAYSYRIGVAFRENARTNQNKQVYFTRFRYERVMQELIQEFFSRRRFGTLEISEISTDVSSLDGNEIIRYTEFTVLITLAG